MSSTDQFDLAEDPVERLLHQDAERWRSTHPAPSLDDAVRRLDGGSRGLPSGWWRPAAVAAAVLVLIGGVLGVVVGRHPPRDTTSPATSSASASGSTPSSLAWAGATLTGLPTGFVPVSGPVQGERPKTFGGPPAGGRVSSILERVWMRSHRSTTGDLWSDSIELHVFDGSREKYVGASSPGYTTTVRGRVGWVSTPVSPGSIAPSLVSWIEEGHVVQVSYTVLSSGSPGSPMSSDELLTAARTFTGPTTSPVTAPGTASLPAAVPGSSLPLQAIVAVTAGPAPDDHHLLVKLTGGLGSRPETASRCTPYEQAVVTAADATSVTVSVGLYAPSSSTPEPPCVASLALPREVSIALDGPLGPRTVIDGSTGRPVVLGAP